MSGKRILLIRDGNFFFYLHQLAEFLTRHEHQVEVLFIDRGKPEPLYRDLMRKTNALGVKCRILRKRSSLIERKVLSLMLRLGLLTKRLAIRPYTIRELRSVFDPAVKYDYIISFDPQSLYLGCKLFPKQIDTIINYSLEIDDETSWVFQRSYVNRSFRYFERSIQSKLHSLMIQDKFRASVLLRNCASPDRVKTILFPVALSGPGLRRSAVRSSSQAGTNGYPPKTIILFFGAIWSQSLVEQLEAVSCRLTRGQVLVIQRGRGSVHVPSVHTDKLIVSTRELPFDQINEFIAGADVGLALYPERSSNNSRYTAFSSEKIARYTQCGIPFVAFRNEDYSFLRAQVQCCELVEDYAEIPEAVDKILQQYDRYCHGAAAAFDRYYRLENTGAELLNEMSST